MMPRVVKGTAAELRPVCIRKAICAPERFADILGVVPSRCFGLLRAAENRPVHDRAVRNTPCRPRINGRQDRCCTSKAPANDKYLIWCQSEASSKGDFLNFGWQLIQNVEDVFVW